MLFSEDFPPVLFMKAELKAINYNRFHHIACNHNPPYVCVSHRKKHMAHIPLHTSAPYVDGIKEEWVSTLAWLQSKPQMILSTSVL